MGGVEEKNREGGSRLGQATDIDVYLSALADWLGIPGNDRMRDWGWSEANSETEEQRDNINDV